MIRAIIVDDEQPARDGLRNYLAENCGSDVEVVGMADSVKTALEEIRIHQPDLVFLDVEMPNGNGFDLLRQLPVINFKIIFVTGWSDYAVKAFRHFATDYLLKPININELVEAVGKVRTELTRELDHRNIELLLKNTGRAETEFTDLVIRDLEGFMVLDTRDIICCEADGYCTHFYLKGNRKETSSRHLKHYEEMLGEQGFLRVHNSYLINVKHVNGYQHEGVVLLSENRQVPLGNAFKKRFQERFKRY